MLAFYILAAITLTSNGLCQEKQTCGYDACEPTVPGRLNVHLVPHSHDDVGWLKTVDQYYSGSYRNVWDSDNEVQRAGVQYTIDTVIRELAFDPKKKYIQVETAFFWRWWVEQDDLTKDLVIDLVHNGQIEFIGGGWCMNDEAAAHYVSIIDQMSLGFKKLKDIFGDCGVPITAWQIDPFGHSREQADLFNEMGFDALFFGRLDYREKSQRLTNLTAEMLWETSDEPKSDKHLLTGVLFNSYSPPDGFCWDLLCNDAPLMDNPDLYDYNMNERAQEFINYARNQHQYYTSDNILLTMGMDFHYQAAHSWFKNLDKLIHYINTNLGEQENIHLLYSTPSCYVKARGMDLENVPLKKDDFFPYASDPHAYWTGYFSSRPTSKFLIRETSRWLQFARVFSSKVVLLNDTEASSLANPLEEVAQAVGITQHHDAITGTEKQHVANDYHKILHNAVHGFAKVANFTICPLLNISQCEVTEDVPDNKVTLVVYNPLGHNKSGLIHLPVTTNGWDVVDQFGTQLDHQIVELPTEILNIPGRRSKALYDLAIKVQDVPPIGFGVVRIRKTTDSKSKRRVAKKKVMSLGKSYRFRTSNGYHTVKYTPYGITHVLPNQNFFNFGFGMYHGHPGDNTQFEFRASGAYIFRPLEQKPVDLRMTHFVLHDGPLYLELHLTFQYNTSAVYRVSKGDSLHNGELEWLVGPISIDDGFGKEFVVKWTTKENFNQQTVFYTDSNGRQLLKRQRNGRDSYDPENAFLEEPVSANYYPINSGILILDEAQNSLMSVVTDRAQGASSLKDSEIEIMVHRRLLDDDAFGVAEPLNETAFGKGLVARGRQFVHLDEDISDGYAKYRLISNSVFGDFLTLFNVDNKFSFGEILKSETLERKFELPININLLTLDPIIDDVKGIFTREFVLRLEHIFATGEHPILSSPVTLDLIEVFGSEGLGLGKIVEIRETLLGANQERISEADVDPRLVEMKPLQIRTFIAKFE